MRMPKMMERSTRRRRYALLTFFGALAGFFGLALLFPKSSWLYVPLWIVAVISALIYAYDFIADLVKNWRQS